jgi:nucleoside-diphosphate-sugar epimerase
MRVLVTGHEGYIGSVMTPLLQASGHEVVGLDSGFFADCTVAPVDPIPTVRRDLRDVKPRDVDGFDAVIHLAGLSNDPLGYLDPELTYQINFVGSLRLALAAKEAHVERFLFASSCSLYGTQGDLPAVETTPFAPKTPYAETKAWLERALIALTDDGFSPVLLRNATAHGWSPRLRGDLVVHDLLGVAMSTGKVVIKSDGTPWRPLVHVQDISAAFLASLEAPRDVIHGEALNVGSDDDNYQVRQIAEMVSEIVEGSIIEYATGGEPDKRDYRVDFTKIGRILPAFQPKWTLAASLHNLRDEYLAAGVTHDLLMSFKCTRLRRIQQLLADGRLASDLTWTTRS